MMDVVFKSAIHSSKKGFTLIEVLVVIGILSILATVALVAINPAEAQKKARDTARLKDMATLQSIVEQYLSDNPGAAAVPASWAGGVSSGTGATPKNCAATGWLGVNLCPYASVIPIDPSNRSTKVVDNPAGGGAATTQTLNAYYYLKAAGGAYKICTYMESLSNANKMLAANDGGNSDDMFEVYSDSTATCP